MKCLDKFPYEYISPTYSYIKYAQIKIFILLTNFGLSRFFIWAKFEDQRGAQIKKRDKSKLAKIS